MLLKPFLILQNVTIKSFNKILFENINLLINEGEHWAITGTDDVKSSSFLQIFMNNYLLEKGTISYCFYENFIHRHKPVDPLFIHRHLIALVSQKHNFKNLSNIHEFYYQQRYNAHDAEDAPTVKTFLSEINHSIYRSEWTFERTINSLELSSLLDEHIIKLSNGETKRLLIAAALLKNPSLLLLDHPFTGLDVDMRKKLNGIIKEIVNSGITIIMATTPHEIPDVISHVAILEDEKLTVTFEKDKFQAKALQENSGHDQNVPEINSLVNSNPLQEYNCIARLENVNVKYGEKMILNNINWEIRQGERWALLGPNGAGKTTLLSLINGDNPQAYANNILLFDKKRGSGESIWDIKEKIGFMSPELYQYFPSSFTGIKSIESGFYDSIGLFRKSDPQKVSTSLMWMHMLQIEDYAEHLFHTLPQDIQRLCLLARALVKNPPLLLLDEPCQGLNPNQKRYFKILIDKICKMQNTTIIYVTHYLEEIPTSVTLLLRLKNGEIIFKGDFDPM